MNLRGHGIRADLPRGWEGAIRREFIPADDATAHVDGDGDGDGEATTAAVGVQAPPVVHMATFPLPGERGDFGSGAVDLMADSDAFVALLEYGPDEADTPLFAAQGLPRRLDPRNFSTRSLQRSLRRQAGWQHFFTEAGRAFCLYVVLGDHGDANRQVRKVEEVLTQVVIEPASSTAPHSEEAR